MSRNETVDVPMLIVYQGSLAGTRWPVTGERFTIGRGADCDLVLLERQISRYHASIERVADGYILRDLGSKNGTFVNQEQVGSQPYHLQDGDEISLALAVKIGFVAGEATVPLEDRPATAARLQVDWEARQVQFGRRVLDPPLSPAQFALLSLLGQSGGRVVTRQEIIEAVWPDALGGVTDQAIDALVYRLRERLAELDPDHTYVVTVRGHGFRFQSVGDSSRSQSG